MPGTITPLLTDISLCDATTGWTAVGGTNTLNVDVPIQGSGCIHNYAASVGNRGSDYDFGSDKNYLENTNLYFWFALSKTGIIGDYGLTGLRIRVTNNAGDWGEWFLFGKDTVAHNGWIPWTVRTTLPFDAKSATPPVLSAIRKVGWRADAVLAKGYIYFDAWRYGTGLKVTAGTELVPVTWADVFAADDDGLKKYGVILKYEGVYYLQGQIQIGDTGQTAITYFEDASKTIVFQNAKVDADFYAMSVVGAASYKTSFILGAKSGVAGISGCVLNAASSAKPYKFTATDTNIDKFGLYGCSFIEAATISLPAYSATREVLNCNFEGAAQILPDTCTMQNCNFVSADAKAIKFSNPDAGASQKVAKSSFINNPTALEINVAGTYNIDALKFSGNTVDIDNTSGGAVIVNCSNGADPSQAKCTGDTTVNNPVTLTLTGLIGYSEVRIYAAGTITELGGIEDSGTSFAYNYTYAAGTYVDIVVHKEDRIYYRLENYLLASTNASLPITQQFDRQYENL